MGKDIDAPVGSVKAHGLEVDVDFGARMLQQPLRGLLIDDDGQQAVLQRIAAKYVGDFGADDCAKSDNPAVPKARVRAMSRSQNCVLPPVSVRRELRGGSRTNSAFGEPSSW